MLFHLRHHHFDIRSSAAPAAVRCNPRISSGIFQLAARSSTDVPAFFAACTAARNSRLKFEYSRRSATVIWLLWPVMIVSTFLSGVVGSLHQRFRDLDAAAAVDRVEQWHVLAREDVAGMHDAQGGEDDPRVTVRVAAAKVARVRCGRRPLPIVILSLKVRVGRPRPLFFSKMVCVSFDGAKPLGAEHLRHVRLGVLAGR